MAKTQLSPVLAQACKGKAEAFVQEMIKWQEGMPCKNNPHDKLPMSRGCWCRTKACHENCMLFKEWVAMKPQEVSNAEGG